MFTKTRCVYCLNRMFIHRYSEDRENGLLINGGGREKQAFIFFAIGAYTCGVQEKRRLLIYFINFDIINSVFRLHSSSFRLSYACFLYLAIFCPPWCLWNLLYGYFGSTLLTKIIIIIKLFIANVLTQSQLRMYKWQITEDNNHEPQHVTMRLTFDYLTVNWGRR